MNLCFRNIRSIFRGVGLALNLSWGVGLTGPWGSAALGQVCNYEIVATITGPECSPGDFASFSARALDEQGNAAGSVSCSFTPTAAVWTGQGTALPLSGPPNVSESTAYALTDPDHIVGRALPSGQPNGLEIATFWEFGNGTLLGALPGDLKSKAFGINSSRQIIGESSFGTNGLRAFRWENDVFEALELPLGPSAIANDVNESGQIVGFMGGAVYNGNAFLWDNGVVIDLGKIPGGDSADALAINNLGHVAGRGWLPLEGSIFGEPHAFFWDGQTMIDLGTLPDHKRSIALELNDLDQIVGASSFVGEDINTSHAIIWQDGALFDLNDLVITDLGSVEVGAAIAINNNGWIVAGTTAGERVLLKPFGSAPGDIDNNCIVNVNDLLLLLGEWGNANSFADTNEDGIVNVLDLLQLLADWG